MATISTDADYSAGSYSNNEGFTITQGAKFTIDQSTIDLRNMRCTSFGECLVKNESTTTPIIVSLGSTGGTARWQFTAGGISTIQGEWIVLGTGDGVAGQTFNIPQAQGVNGIGTQDVPVIEGLFIDDNDTLRDGTSIPQLCLEVDSASYTNATDHERGGNVFTFDVVAQTVTFKRAVPVGKNVVIPNIIFYTSTNFTGASEFDILASSTGTFNWDKCLWSGKFDCALNNGKKITLNNLCMHTSLVKQFNLTSQVEPPVLQNVILKSLSNTVLNISNSASAGSFKNLWVESYNDASNNIINCSNSSSPYLEKIVTTNYSYGTGTLTNNNNRAAIITTSGNSTFYDIFNFVPMQTILFGSNGSNCVADNIKFQFGCREDGTGQANTGAIRLSNCSNNVITNVEQIKAGPLYFYGIGVICAAGTSNNTIDNVIFRSGAAGSGNNRIDNVANDGGFQNRYNNFTMYGHYKDTHVVTGANSLGATFTNFYTIDKQNETAADFRVGARVRAEQIYLNNTNNSGNGNFDPSATASGVDSLSVMGIRNTANGGLIDKTDGLFYLRMSPTDQQTDYFTTVTQTGVIFFNNNNVLYIENSGDVVELESFVHHNVSAIGSSLVKQGSGTGSFSVTVKMRRPEGTYTNYVATTQSDMQVAYSSLPSDSQHRVQFKFRIERTSTNLTQYLQGLRFNVTLTGDDYPFVLDPGIINVTNGTTYTVDAGKKFVVDTDSITEFTISGIIPKEIETIGTGSTTIIGIDNAKVTTTTISGTGTLALGDGLNPSSNWVVGSGTLTLTGTESDLLGLRGLADVDYADAGGKIVYTVNDTTRIIIPGTGDLTIDSDVEQLVCGVTPANGTNTLVIQSGGRLQLGLAKNVGGFTIYSGGPAIVFNNDTSEPLFTVTHGWANFIIQNGGRLDWYGGEIQTVGQLGVLSGAIFRTYSSEAIFVSVPSKLQSSRPEAYIRQDTTNIEVNGLVNKFGIFLSVGKPTVFKGYEPISSGSAIDMSNQSQSSTYYDYENLIAGKGNTRDIGGKHSTWLRLLNTNLGSDIIVTSQESTAGSDQDYIVESKKSLLLNYIDEEGTILENAKVYMRDTDHGSRLAASQIGSNVDYVADRIYTGTSDVSGDIDFTSVSNAILISVHHHSQESGNVIYDIFDSRGLQNDNTDLFTFLSISYLQTPANVTLEMKGTGILNHSQVLVTDLLLTESNKATVDAYTELETPQKFYDRAKSYLYDNFQGEATTIVTREGNVIDCGGYDLVVDATTSSVFDLTGNTITIKASTFVGELITTGTITFVNGATIDGAYTDTNGTVRLVNVSAMVTDTSTNPIGSANCLVYQQTPEAITSITRSGSVATVTKTSHNLNVGDYFIVRGANEIEYNRLHQVTNVIDANSFEYNVSGTPSTPATGTITLQIVYLNGLTNASGYISNVVNYISDQPVVAIIRKSLYKNASLNATLTTIGAEIQASLISDQ